MKSIYQAVLLAALASFHVQTIAGHGDQDQAIGDEQKTSQQQKIPIIVINKQFEQGVVGARLYDRVKQGDQGSLTGKSVQQAQKELSAVPGAVSLVPSEAYQAGQAKHLKDMMASVPGVYVQKRFGEEARLSIRGSGVSRNFHLRGVQILQDGIPQNLSDDSADFQQIDPLITRYVEVYKGANALRYGASSLGGAINLVTPTGHTAQSRHEARADVGTDDYYRLHVKEANVNGDYDYFVAATGIKVGGFRPQSEEETGRFSANLGVKVNDKIENRTYITYNHINLDVPGTLSLHDALHHSGDGNATNMNNQYARDVRSTRVSNKTSIKTGDNEQVDLGVYANQKDLFHPIYRVIDQQSMDTGLFARMEGRYTVAGFNNRYVVGSNLKEGFVDAKQLTNNQGHSGAKLADQRQEAQQFDVYAQNDFFVRDDLLLVTGAQWLKATRDSTDDEVTGTGGGDKAFTALNPKVGVVWDVNSQAQVFANVSRSEEVPTFSEAVQTISNQPIFVNDLDAQRAWTSEVGTRGQDGIISWDVALYRSAIRGELLGFSPAPNVPAATFNADETLHQGVELGVDVDVSHWLLAVSNSDRIIVRQLYTLNDFAFEDDAQYGDNDIAGVPRHVYRTEVRYEHQGLKVTPSVEWARDGYVDFANTQKAPDYTVWGLTVSQTIVKNVEAFVDVQNLLNDEYVATYNTLTNYQTASASVQKAFYTGDARTVQVGVKVNW